MLNRGLDKQELLRVVDSVANEKSIDKELILSSMETAIQKAAYSKFGSENEIEAQYYHSFASDGFFWGQQFQEEQVREYNQQDKEACDWARTQIDQGHTITYDCSW